MKMIKHRVFAAFGTLGVATLCVGIADAQNEIKYRALKVGEARVAVDYDGDLIVDDVAVVDIVALDKARTDGGSSEKAKNGKNDPNPKVTLTGKIKSKSVTELSDGQPVCLVKFENVETEGDRDADDRPSEALLGPKGEFGNMKLEQGAELKITGRCGRLDGREVVIAEAVMQGDATVRVTPPSALVRMFAGTVENLTDRTFANHDGTFVLADMKMADGRDLRVNLGRKKAIEQFDLTEGDRVELLARPGQIDGEPALIAQRVRFEGKKKRVSPPTDAGSKGDA